MRTEKPLAVDEAPHNRLVNAYSLPPKCDCYSHPTSLNSPQFPPKISPG